MTTLADSAEQRVDQGKLLVPHLSDLNTGVLGNSQASDETLSTNVASATVATAERELVG